MHVVVAHDPAKWLAVPANNGANGPQWQWGDELLVGYTSGTARFDTNGHQTDDDRPCVSMLARSTDGGRTWTTGLPGGTLRTGASGSVSAAPLQTGVGFASPDFAMRVEGHGYHGNRGAHWFASDDRGRTWSGPFTFGRLLADARLAGRQFTGRTAYLVEDGGECLLFASARSEQSGMALSASDKPFVARWSADAGRTWSPEMVLRDDFFSVNGHPSDSGYVRLFERTDSLLVAVYFWCSPERPQTHIAATLFALPCEGRIGDASGSAI